MQFSEMKSLILSDLHRYRGNVSLKEFFIMYLRNPGFKFSFWLRVVRYLKEKKLYLLLYYFAHFMYMRCTYRFGISIPIATQIGSGFYIGHYGGIVVNGGVVIGKNCNISQGVTIGVTNRGQRAGNPNLGDNIYIGPGAIIIGGIKIGNNAAIGANCVVTKDVPDNAVVVGVPGKVISYEGSTGYVNFTDYP